MTVAPERPSRKSTPVHPFDRFLIDEPTAAALCSVCRPTFRDWVADGLIHPVDLPRHIRRTLYRRSDVEAFVARLDADTRRGE